MAEKRKYNLDEGRHQRRWRRWRPDDGRGGEASLGPSRRMQAAHGRQEGGRPGAQPRPTAKESWDKFKTKNKPQGRRGLKFSKGGKVPGQNRDYCK
jgi:hypothetical protein